jgi:hypothetical protein
MKRTEFYSLIQPLIPKLYSMAHGLLPDDLQAEQLVIDSINAFLVKESSSLLKRGVKTTDKKEVQLLRRNYYKMILKNLSDIGARRSFQLKEQMQIETPENYGAFYALEPKIRLALKLRFEANFSVDEIQDILQIPRFEVIEKLHNGRYLMVSNLNEGVQA